VQKFRPRIVSNCNCLVSLLKFLRNDSGLSIEVIILAFVYEEFSKLFTDLTLGFWICGLGSRQASRLEPTYWLRFGLDFCSRVSSLAWTLMLNELLGSGRLKGRVGDPPVLING
jgi:hypothetical protein